MKKDLKKAYNVMENAFNKYSKNIGQDLNARVALIILEKEAISLLIIGNKVTTKYLIIKV